MKKLFLIALLVLPFQFATAQTQQELAEMALAVDISYQLNNDNNPGNDVKIPLTLSAARALIASAPVSVVNKSIAYVAAGSPTTSAATAVAAAAAANNAGISPESAASEVNKSSVFSVTTANVATASAAMTSGTGSGTTSATGFTGTGRGTGSRTGTGGAGGGALASDDATDLLVALGVDSETAIEIIEAIEEEGMSL